MSVKVLYFAGLREALGIASETIELPNDITTMGGLRDWLIVAGREKLATSKNLRCAVNQHMVGPEAAIADGDEVAFFPPVTGG